jgi:hypothetical protein
MNYLFIVEKKCSTATLGKSFTADTRKRPEKE